MLIRRSSPTRHSLPRGSFDPMLVSSSCQPFGALPCVSRAALPNDVPSWERRHCHDDRILDAPACDTPTLWCRNSRRKVHEDDISTLAEEACDPTKSSGRWITEIDIVQVRDGVLSQGLSA